MDLKVVSPQFVGVFRGPRINLLELLSGKTMDPEVTRQAVVLVGDLDFAPLRQIGGPGLPARNMSS